MTKRIFKLRNVAMIACLAGLVMFSGCDKEEPKDPIDTGTEQEANIVTFTFAGIDGTATIDKTAHTVTAKAKETTDLTTIKAEFTLSKNATAKVGSTAQVSGQTANNFTNPVTYRVTSGDGKTTNEWRVTITKTGSGDEFGKRPEVYSISLEGSMTDGTMAGSGTYTLLSILTTEGYYEKRVSTSSAGIGTREEWIVLEASTSTKYWRYSGGDETVSGSEAYGSRESGISKMNEMAAGIGGGCGIWIRLSPYDQAVRTGDEPFLGRDCAKFVYELNVSSITWKEQYWIDKATKACLKFISDFQDDKGGIVKSSHTVTEYKIGGVTLPPHP